MTDTITRPPADSTAGIRVPQVERVVPPADLKPMPEKVINRWLVVAGAVLIQLCLGALYAWSVFTPPLVDAGWTRSQTQYPFFTGLAVFAVVMVVAGRLLPRIGPRVLAITGGIVLGAGYVMAGLLRTNALAPIVLLIGVVGGAGIGLAYVVPIAVGTRWFPDKKGLIMGLAVAGFGFGSLLWVKLADTWGHLIQSVGLGGTFLAYGVVFALLVPLGGLLMVYPPEGWKPRGWTPPKPKQGAVTGAVDFTSAEMLHTPQFYMIFLSYVCGAGSGLMSIGLMKLFPMEALQANGIEKAAASAIAGTAMAIFFALANGMGRILWGWISDSIGRKLSIFLMMIIQGVTLMLFPLMAGTKGFLYLGATIIGFNFGGNLALFPSITADTFGNKHVGQNYPWVFLAYGVGGIAGPLMGGMLGDLGNFPLAFRICGVAVLIAGAIIAAVRPPAKALA